MKIHATKVEFEALGVNRFFYHNPKIDVMESTTGNMVVPLINPVVLSENDYLAEIKKLSLTAVITCISTDLVSPEEYYLNSFEMLIKHNAEIEQRFSHSDPETLQ